MPTNSLVFAINISVSFILITPNADIKVIPIEDLIAEPIAMKGGKQVRPLRAPDVTDLVAEADDAGSQRADRRRQDRLDATQHVSIQMPHEREICDLLDLSASGARLRIAEGLAPSVDTPVAVTLMDGTTINGHVAWVDHNHLGIKFGSAIGDVDGLLSFEDLGDAYYTAALKLQRIARRS